MPRLIDIRVGWFLALRQIRRASRWTTVLIIFVMVLTFLDLVVVSGMLVGIIEGVENLYRQQQTGDVLVSTLDTKNYIEHSPEVISLIRSLPQVDTVSPRYVTGGVAEANYKLHADLSEKRNETGVQISGIEPSTEDAFSHISSLITEGSYLSDTDYDEVLLGSQLLAKYSFGNFPGLTPLQNVGAGSTILVTINGSSREMIVKGVIKTTANSPVSSRAYMNGSELAELMGRTDYNVNEIAIRLKKGTDANAFRDILSKSGIASLAKVQTYNDAIPNGVADIKNTFAMLGNVFSSFGLVVASVTIFIVVFINALTRRKFIGILKGIGISPAAIEVSYMLQSFFYAACGSLFGLIILYGFLVPLIAAHPIQLPISNAILVAPIPTTLLRIVLLVCATVIAGYLPSRMIVGKNTLDSILGRN